MRQTNACQEDRAMHPRHCFYVFLLASYFVGSLTDEFDDLIRKGQKQLDEFRFPQAVESFAQAVALKPNNPKGYYHRSLALFNHTHFEDALKDISKCISLDRKYPSAFTHRGTIYFAKEDYDHSIADFTEAILI